MGQEVGQKVRSWPNKKLGSNDPAFVQIGDRAI